MAKSLRSKRKRKMKAIKRIRYGEKERKRLDLLVENNNKKGLQSVPIFGQQMKSKDIEIDSNETEVESMDTTGGVKRNKKTMRDQFGHYPQWMNGRHVKKIKDRLKRLKTKPKTKKK